MLDLRTAEEMYDYCKNNNLGIGNSKGWAIKHFQLLIDNLKPDEVIHCVFIGLHNYKSLSKHDNNYAYAMTDKRIIMAQHKMFGANVQSVNIENINDITLSKTGIGGLGIGTVCIDTFKETFNVGVNVSFASNIYDKAHEVWDEIRAKKDAANNVAPAAAAAPAKSPVEQIKEYKELLDMGIISQEEFDAKKKQLLGL